MKSIILFLIISLFGVSYAADRAITPVIGNPEDFYSVSTALIIGEYDYSGGWPKLPGVKQDIQAVESALSKQNFKVIKSLNPNKDELKSVVESFLNKYGNDPKARIIIYFAGHGHTQNSKGYLVLKDAKDPSKDMSGFRNGAIEIEYFSNMAKSINAKHTLFVFDSCFSGSIFTAMRSIPEFLLDMLKKPAREFITSGSENQQVPDDSVFRRRFIDGIDGQADENSDGVVTGSELGMYLQSQVSDYTKGSQTPVFGKLKNSDGEFVFFANVTPKKEMQKAGEGEKEQLLARIKKNPSSPDANNALKRLREIDDSLKNMPPVEAKERKDLVIKATSTTIITYDDNSYPYVVIAPVNGTIGNKNVTAAFRLRAQNSDKYRQIVQREAMLKSVMGHKIDTINVSNSDTMSGVRDKIKSAAKDAIDFACPACTSGDPVLIGLKVY